MRFTPEELALLKGAFADNDALLMVLRKVFLPELDPVAPIGQLIDLWMTVDVRTMNPEQAQVLILARQQLIGHLEQQLMQIQILANQKEETADEAAARQQKDSTK